MHCVYFTITDTKKRQYKRQTIYEENLVLVCLNLQWYVWIKFSFQSINKIKEIIRKVFKDSLKIGNKEKE